MQANAIKNRILHLSDVHFDNKYTPGLSTECGEPLCCRPPNEKGEDIQHLIIIVFNYFATGEGETAAGFWGDHNCDVPPWTLENLFATLAQKSDEVVLLKVLFF